MIEQSDDVQRGERFVIEKRIVGALAASGERCARCSAPATTLSRSITNGTVLLLCQQHADDQRLDNHILQQLADRHALAQRR
jgi:hypothetical protein